MICRKRPAARRTTFRGGLTLFEVILALAIMGGAVAIISQAAWSGLENARMAQELVQAELLTENVMAELVVGIRPMEAEQDGSFEEDDSLEDPDLWLYSIEITPSDIKGLSEVRVTVKVNTERPRPVSYSLVRLVMDAEEEESEESDSG